MSVNAPSKLCTLAELAARVTDGAALGMRVVYRDRSFVQLQTPATRDVLVLEHDYPDKRVRLDVWHVLKFRGRATPREGQPLRWVTAAECLDLPLLPADGPIVARLASLGASTEVR